MQYHNLQGTCLCLSGQGQGSVVYCYGDPSARSLPGAQLTEEHGDTGGLLGGLASYSLLDIAQLAVYSLGILAMYVPSCQHQLLIPNHYYYFVDSKSVKCPISHHPKEASNANRNLLNFKI